MRKHRKKYSLAALLVAALVLIASIVAVYAYRKQNNALTSTDKVNAQSAGEEFMAAVQKNDPQAALKLSTPGFKEHPSPYIKDSSLQRFQSERKATSSGWTFTPASKGNPATAKATYITYISVKADQPAHYTVTLQKTNGSWLVSGFDASP